MLAVSLRQLKRFDEERLTSQSSFKGSFREEMSRKRSAWWSAWPPLLFINSQETFERSSQAAGGEGALKIDRSQFDSGNAAAADLQNERGIRGTSSFASAPGCLSLWSLLSTEWVVGSAGWR